MSKHRITLGGWPAFSELDYGVSKKEPVETFDWLPSCENTLYGLSEREYFEDCKLALDRVEGSREWLKAHEGNFSDETSEMFWKIVVGMLDDHSGFSGSATLNLYRALLRDWDGWVYAQKRRRALLIYKARQPSLTHLKCLISCLNDYNEAPNADLEHEIKYNCALICISGSLTELREILEYAIEETEGPPLEDSPPAPPIFMPFLPLGAHLLPPVFQELLKKWNIDITSKTGDWIGVPRKQYKRLYPGEWAEFHEENQRLTELYSEEVAAVKAYQAEHAEEPVGESEVGNDNSNQPD